MPAKKGDKPKKSEGQGKGDKEQGAGDKNNEKDPEKGNDSWERIKPLLTKTGFKCAVYFTDLLLFIVAVLLIFLYFQKVEDITEGKRASIRIAKFMSEYNASFREQTTIEKFKGAEELLPPINYYDLRTEEVLRTLDGVYDRLHKNWKSFGGYMYEFNNKPSTYYYAYEFCQNRSLSLIEIHSEEEQKFFVRLCDEMDLLGGFWIGLQAHNNSADYIWPSGRKATKIYWEKGSQVNTKNPIYNSRELCIHFRALYCRNQKTLNCWNDVDCGQPIKFFCKMKPDTRWLRKGLLKQLAVSVQATAVGLAP